MNLKKYLFYIVFFFLTTSANAVDTWKEGTTYHIGDIVTYKNKYYEAIQSYTAYPGTNWTPVTSPALWKEITPITDDPDECHHASTENNILPCSEESVHKLIDVTFDNHPTGPYQAADFRNDWGISPNNASGLTAGRLNIVNDPTGLSGNVLRVTYAAGQVGGNSAMVFNVPFLNINKTVWFQYRVMFDSDFTWVKGGKLPGLAGADRPTGCIDNGTFDGFSTRLMWRENGSVYGYLYYPDKQDRCGDYFHTNVNFISGRWYTITQQVTLNEPGKYDGSLVQYINGKKVLSISHWQWRKSTQVETDAIKMDTFFGGSTSDWAPQTDQYAYFDNFIVTTTSPLPKAVTP